jgi:ABC-type amino acid transport substrate-binding protein
MTTAHHIVPLPPLGTPADNLMYVLTGKTDFVIFPKIMYQMYEKENPGKLKLVKIDPPLRAYGNVIAIGIDDLKLQQLLNASVNELVNSGMYNEIMRKYDEQYPGAFLRVAKQYQ